MTSFRSFLARERLVPVEQLDRALQRQILYGEDLSVNLLEMGVVDEEELAQFLGMFHRLPIVTRSDLASVPPEIAARVPSEVAVRHRVCPVAGADDAIVVAATRLLDRAVLAELETLTRASVSLTIASPVTLSWGLHALYGVEIPPRYQRILERPPRQSRTLPPPGPGPAVPEEEEPAPMRRASGIIVLPDDVPESERATVTDPAGGIPSTPEASVSSPPPPSEAPLPPPLAAPAAPGPDVDAAEILRGVSLSQDNPADRLLEMVLGRPAERPTSPPPGPGRVPAPSAVLDVAAAVLGTAPLPAAAPAPPAGAPVEPAAAASAQPASSVGSGASSTAVVRVSAVLLDASGEPPRAAAPTAGLPPAVAALVGEPAGGAPVAGPPRTSLVDRIARLDALGTPTEVLRYAFQLFSAPFRAGLLFDTTATLPRLRDAFGLRGGVTGHRGRELDAAVLPPVVRNAAQPLLVRLEPDGPLAELLAELFGGPPVNALFLPVTVGSRVVAVMYGDNREALTVFENVRELFHLAWAVGTRLGELVRRRHRAEPPGASAADSGVMTEPGVPPPVIPGKPF